MKVYILDDVYSIVKILDKIISERKLGEVIGYTTDPNKGIEKIIAQKPDIVLLDLLMPGKDGISVVKEIREICPKIKFIMISRVTDKAMVSEAYRAGVEYFITKPINVLEVESILKHVIHQIKMEKILTSFKDMLHENELSEQNRANSDETEIMKSIQYLLGILGMMGERGTTDIQNICRRCIADRGTDVEKTIKAYCAEIDETEKTVKQRIRRAAKKGLVNMAHLGIEDSYNEIYQNYAQLVFDYESLHKHIAYIRGESREEGKINLSSFIEGLLIYGYNQ